MPWSYKTHRYDGMERTFYVKTYNMPDHPRWSEDWITPGSVYPNVFSVDIFLEGKGEVDKLLERGKYCIRADVERSSTRWNYRSVRLNIDVV